MKKILAILMTLMLVFCLAACGENGTTEEPTTRSQEELIAEANEAAAKLVEYKETLDKQLVLVNSADNTDEFFDLAGMTAAGAQFDAVYDLIDFDSIDSTNTTDGDASPVKNAVKAKEAADQVREIAEKVNTAANKYYAQFVAAYPGCEMTKMYCLTVFMSGEPSNFFAADYTDTDGSTKTVYAISSFTAGAPEDTLSTITTALFAESPISSLDATKDGNFNIDMAAVRAALEAEATEADTAEDTTVADTTVADTTVSNVTDGNVTDGNVTDGNA